ncbi:hypothetical protein TPHA_0O00630 [Tetrapisispora phaffii CBS 4417]|uniref:Uncharacterized protein n=1 Tax=Tetrapisispora phaffii (strain ATCC 24235 / CBS 4417 / NBRC 1672 / NRRL Y-8282 / UCD 70-5) TaxID=1071381 RepID=G8C1K5_TETPH|nr:hypothetical protein TPHA_0O00630 [Tetrapisispora phaffii CBS 4417]CCE66033.1 hypothetical protein TPHA_0O00630 [Tetrapisispora phaffii CBS 4417]
MEERDLETQQLLNQPAAPENDIRQRALIRERTKKSVIVSCFFLGIIILTSFYIFIKSNIPPNDVIQQSIFDISQVEVNRVSLDGWTDGGDALNNDGGKFLQISAFTNITLNYDKWNSKNYTSELTDFQKKSLRNINEHVIKELCIDFENISTYNGMNEESKELGTIFLKDTICINVRNNITTPIKITLLLKPNTKNIVDVLKKIWKKDYDHLNIWSDMSLKLSKKSYLLFGANLRFYTLDNIKLNWQKFINWKKNEEGADQLRHLFDNITINSIRVTDSETGFDADFTAEIPTFIDYSKLIEIPRNMKLPKLKWQLKLPNCNGVFDISLHNIDLLTNSFPIRNVEKIKIGGSASIFDFFPNELMNDICWYNDENIQTPMSRLIDKLLNSTELITIQTKPSLVEDENCQNCLIPGQIMKEAFDVFPFLPVKANITANFDKLVDNFTIEDLKIKWINTDSGQRKLSMVGKLIGLLNLSFYQTSGQKISVQNLKGNISLYHNEIHFLSLPMKVWHNATSEIIHDINDGHSLMKLYLELPNDEIEIINKWELTKFLNEIMFGGSSLVHAIMDLDVNIKTIVGEIVLFGVKTENDVIVR